MLEIISTILGLFTCNCGNENDELNDIKEDIRTIKENHLQHIEKDMSELKLDVRFIKENILDIKLLLNKLS